MKHLSLSVAAVLALLCLSIPVHSQNITRLGTNALANNTSSGIFNVGIGYYSLFANTTGVKNTGIGSNTLHFNTVGAYNTAGGYASLYKNDNGSENIAYGHYSLFSNVNGFYNTALGTYALQANISGSSNTAVGYKALYTNTGSFNTALGYGTLYGNTSGYYNAATGYNALGSNTTGYNNTANGFNSMVVNTTGFDNTAIGIDALHYNNGFGNVALGSKTLYYNSSGIGNVAIGNNSLQNNNGSHNVATGSSALYTNQSGRYNTATGDASLFSNVSGLSNTANGDAAMTGNTTGSFNTGVGYAALAKNTVGFGNTALGDSADVITGNLQNATAIGYRAIVDRSNKVRVGNTIVTSIGGQVGWTTFSDGRYKTNINENVPGLSFINSLRPVTYTLNVKGLNEYYRKGDKNAVSEKNIQASDPTADAAMEKSVAIASKVNYNGFVAQEVETAAKKLNFDFSGVDKPETSDGLYGLRYDNFIAPLVKAIQELSQQNADLKKQVEELRSLVLADHPNTKNTTTLANASIEQNVPNPFGNATTIYYKLPQEYAAAKIVITGKDGSTIKEVNVSGKGKGSLNIDSKLLSSGAYNYSLYVDGKIVGTRQMLLAK